MAIFNIYLGEIGTTGLSETEKSGVKSKLEGWFAKITADGDTALATWVKSPPSAIQDHELLAYFVSGSGSSILKFMPGSTGGGSNNGLTVFGSSSASEIYVSNSPSGLAELTFHELMHNKLQMNDADLHKKDGLAAKVVPLGDVPSTVNLSDMKTALKNSHKQWTGGWMAASDPSNGYI